MKTSKTQKAANSVAITVITTLALVAPSQAIASSSFANDTTRARSNLTFVAKPYDATRNYMIFELGLKTKVAGPPDFLDVSNLTLVGELGAMHNVNEKTSFGAALYASACDRYSTIGFKPRIRHWLSRSRGVDFSAGILLSVVPGFEYSESFRSPGFVLSSSIDLSRSLVADVTLESVQIETVTGSDMLNSLYLGVRGKDYLAAAGATALAVLIVLLTVDSGSYGLSSGSSW